MEDFEALKKKYEEEMMRYSADEANIDSAEQSSQAEDLANRENAEEMTIIPENIETGFMQIRATALQQSVPVSGAKIVISRPVGEEASVMWSDTTDESGKSSVVELPAPSRELSERPNGGAVPYAVYNVRVDAQGFYTVYNINAQVFPGQLSIVAVDMIPKKETELFSEEDMTFETPPSNLLDT